MLVYEPRSGKINQNTHHFSKTQVEALYAQCKTNIDRFGYQAYLLEAGLTAPQNALHIEPILASNARTLQKVLTGPVSCIQVNEEAAQIRPWTEEDPTRRG